MLELRPICEHCATALPADSAEARICSFECTFCARCVDEVLRGICPNCGGNFVARPIRPKRAWWVQAHLGAHPAATEPKHRPVEEAAHEALIIRLRDLPPSER